MLGEIRDADYFWVGMSVLIGCVPYYSRAARWLILLEPLGYKPKISNRLYSIAFGYFANMAAPRIGEIARCSALNKVEKIPLDLLIGTVILERALDVLILFLLVGAAFFLNLQMFGRFFIDIFQEKLNSLNGETVIHFAWLSFIFAAILVAPIFLFRKKIRALPMAEKVKGFLRGVFDGFAAIGKIKKKYLFMLHTGIIWFSYIMMTVVGFLALQATAHLSFADGIFITAAGGIGMAAPANAGIGTFHAAVMFALAAVGVEKNAGLAFAVMMHTSQMLFIVISGIFSFVMLYIEKKSRGNGSLPTRNAKEPH
jgi:hypothetical protein